MDSSLSLQSDSEDESRTSNTTPTSTPAMSKKELREERIRKAIDRSRRRYTTEAAYTEAQWYAGMLTHPHDFDTLKEDVLPDKITTNIPSVSNLTISSHDAVQDVDPKLDMRMVEFNLTRLYREHQHISCLSIILPLLQLHTPEPTYHILLNALHHAYANPTESITPLSDFGELAHPARGLLAGLRKLGVEEVGTKETQTRKALVEMGLRSGCRVLSRRRVPSESLGPGGNVLGVSRNAGQDLQDEAGLTGLRSVLVELADKGRAMGRKPGNGALADVAGRMHMALGRVRDASICFLAAIGDRGLCAPYVSGLKVALYAVLAKQDHVVGDATPPASAGETLYSAEATAALSALLDNVGYLDFAEGQGSEPLFGRPRSNEIVLPPRRTPPERLTQTTADLIAEAILARPAGQQRPPATDVEEDKKDADIVNKVCVKISAWVGRKASHAGAGGEGREEGDTGRSVRTL